MNNKTSIKQSMMIVGIEKFTMIFFQFFSSIIMARLLCPDDYGKVAMLSIFMSLASTLVDSGFGGSLIYHKDVTRRDFSTVFWINMMMSVGLYIILVLASQGIASFYNTPILSSLVKVLALSIVFNALGQVQYSMMYKDLQFKKISLINVSTNIASTLVAILLAYLGFGVWALITLQVSSSIFRTTILIWCNRFLPDLFFSKELLKKHWNYGSGLFYSNILRIVYDNMYVQLIGKYTTLTNSGYYNKAKSFKDIPTKLFCKTFTQTLFPIFSKIENDKDFVLRFQNTCRVFAFACCPLFFLLSLLSHNIVSFLLGEKWMESAWIFKMISIGAIFQILEVMNRTALKAKGKSMIIFRMDLIKRSLSLLIIFWGMWKFQILGICVAYVFNSFMGWVINAFVLSRNSCYRFYIQIMDVVRYVALSILVFIALLVLQENTQVVSDISAILLYSFLFIVLYVGIAYILHDSSLKYFIEMIKSRLSAYKL